MHTANIIINKRKAIPIKKEDRQIPSNVKGPIWTMPWIPNCKIIKIPPQTFPLQEN